ncbi:MAG: hypothetical protein PWR02_1706, partial [Synergistales bacterium]|nr:hypothetical protein [Synergistales bacterium]
MNDTNEYTTAAPWPKAIWIDITPQATYVKLKAGLSSCGSIHGRKSVSCFIYFDL